MLNVSCGTLKRRMKEYGIKKSDFVSLMEDDELDQVIVSILKDFLNSGYKKMKGAFIVLVKQSNGRITSLLKTNYKFIQFPNIFCLICNFRQHFKTSYFLIIWKESKICKL